MGQSQLDLAIAGLVRDLNLKFQPPEFIPGCVIQDVTDISEYTTNNGWIEALCGRHNQQRVRYKGFPIDVAVNDVIDVVYYPSHKFFEVHGAGGASVTSADWVKVSDLWESDFDAVAWSTDATGHLSAAGAYNITTTGDVGVGGTTLSDAIHIQGAGTQGLRASNAGNTVFGRFYTDGTDLYITQTNTGANRIFIDPLASDPNDATVNIFRNTNSGGGVVSLYMYAADATATIVHDISVIDSSVFYTNTESGTSGIGIGTSSTSGRLTVRHDGTSTEAIALQDFGDTTADREVEIDFMHGTGISGTTGARIEAVRASGNSNGMSLRFYTETTGGSLTENVRITETGDLQVVDDIVHFGDTDTLRSFTDDAIADQAGGVIMLRLTETTQDLVEIGDVGGAGDVDINLSAGQMFLRGSDGFAGISNTAPQALLHVGAGTDVAAITGATIYASNAGTTTISARDSTNNAEVFMLATSGIGLFGTFTSTDFELRTGNTRRLFIQDSTGRVAINSAGPLAQFHVDQASTTAAIPVLYLDQADISEEMIEFNTTIGVGNAIEAVGAKSLTTTHFIKVTLPGGLTRYIPCGTIA